jgi:hypothetical protein
MRLDCPQMPGAQLSSLCNTAPKAKKGCKKSVKLSANVKKAVVDSLLRSNVDFHWFSRFSFLWPPSGIGVSTGRLNTERTSLQNNGVHGHLSCACQATGTDGPVTRTILVSAGGTS